MSKSLITRLFVGSVLGGIAGLVLATAGFVAMVAYVLAGPDGTASHRAASRSTAGSHA